jgi:hypothetical protein
MRAWTPHELVSDPLAIVRRIYQQLDMRLPEAVAERMQRLAWNRSRHRRRHANPTLADLGLDGSAETRLFDGYCSRFGIPVRKNANRLPTATP